MAKYEASITYSEGEGYTETDVHQCEEFGYNDLTHSYEVHMFSPHQGLKVVVGYAFDRVIKYSVTELEGVPLGQATVPTQERPE